MVKGINQKFISLLGTALLGCAVAAPATVHAGNDAVLQLIKVLRDNGTIDQKAYEALEAATLDEQKATADAAAGNANSTLPKITTKGKLQIASPDGDFKFRLGGRLLLDTAGYTNDTGTWKDSDLKSGTEIRRSRIFLSTTLWRDWNFKTEWEFAGDKVSAKDQYIRYSGFNPTQLNLGFYKIPQGLSRMSSSNHITFMERPIGIEAMEPGRKMGLGLQSNFELGGMWTGGIGFFGGDINAPDADDGEGWGIPVRLTWAPFHEKTQVLHLGTSFEYRQPDDANEVRYRDRPESHIASHRFVDTGTIGDVDNKQLLGVEMLGIYGPFSVQGEYLWNTVERKNNLNDLDFSTAYILGSWIITGESRGYKPGAANISQIKPTNPLLNGGFGAWEVAARYSYTDFEDEDILGGEESNLAFGLNWYPNNNLRFMFNYIKVLDVSSDKEGSFDDVSPDMFQARAQVYF
jgi:phosphate-selective porin OprO/OprP